MPTRYPQYQPPSRKPDESDVKLRYLPDSPEQIRQSMVNCGYQCKLEAAVREAMTRVKRR